MTEVKLLEGKILAAQIQQEIKIFIENLRVSGKQVPGLLVLQANQDPASDWYIGQQEKLAAKLGIYFEKIGPAQLTSQDKLCEALTNAGAGKPPGKFHGIFIAMPFPAGFDADKILFQLDPRKDVEGVHPASLGLIVLRKSALIPPTAFAALKLIESTGVSLRGKKAVIIGQGAIVGRPLQLLLGERRVTTIVCNTGTSQADLQKFIAESDIVVACAGQPGLVPRQWVREGAIVIDVGTTAVGGKLAGDVDFEGAKKRAGFITPVPGGVGPLTVTMLMQNLIKAYEWQIAL